MIVRRRGTALAWLQHVVIDVDPPISQLLSLNAAHDEARSITTIIADEYNTLRVWQNNAEVNATEPKK